MKRVLVVGAGPTGLTIALELARQGLIPEIIEKNPGGPSFSRAVGLLPSSMKVFEPSGVADAIRKEAMVYKTADFYISDKLTAKMSLDSGEGDGALLYGLSQDRTEELLKAALQQVGVNVQHDVTLVSLDIENTHAVATLCAGDGGREVKEYDLVVGADGGHSTVRRSLGLAFEGFDLPEKWSIADVDVEGWDTSSFSLFRLPKGRVAVVAPLEENRVRIVSNTADAIQAVPVPIKILRTRQADSFKIAVRQVTQYSYGPAYLAGESAHCHSPIGGRGMNLGIADAADLANRIITNDLEGYGAARYAAGRETIAFSERGRRAMTTRNGVYRMQVTMLLGLLARNRRMRERTISRLLALS